MEYRTLRFSLTSGVARVTFCRAETGNRIDHRMLDELDDAASLIADSSEVAVALLDAEGDDFCLGWDEGTRAALMTSPEPPLDLFDSLASLACPVVASVQGGAVSGGLELALACDIRIADAGARFSLPEIAEGRLPLAGATQRLPRVTGKATALSMLLLGEELDGQRAYQTGLVSRLTEPGRLQPETEAVVAAIASRGPLALRYAKEATVRGIDMTLDQGLRFETDLSVILQSTEDRAEGLRAFFKKRPPKFEGR